MTDPYAEPDHLRLVIDELRLQLSESNEHIAALEITTYRQQQQLDLLQGQLRKLYQQMQGQGSSADGGGAALADDPRDDIPPHY